MENEVLVALIFGTLLFLLLAIFFGAFIILFLRKNKLNILEKASLKAQFEQEILTSQNEIQEETMKYISRELHDNVVQMLALVKIQLNHLSEESPENTRVIHSKEYLGFAIDDLRSFSKTYLLKDSETSQLKIALIEVLNKGYYHTELVTNTLMKSIKPNHTMRFSKPVFTFQSREEEFLKLVCTELTYKEIADKMNLSPRTVDGYRESLFEKLELKSRVGLVLFAIKNGIVHV
jgi:DNA-binding NarL/FixJ family response regulator